MPVQSVLALSLKCIGRELQRRRPAAMQYLLISEMFYSLLEATCARKGGEEYIDSTRGRGLCAPQHILHRKLDSLVEDKGNVSPEQYYNAQYSQFYF